jgi:sigma-B regulation protein RsbU (phosphoserine phosphatase)
VDSGHVQVIRVSVESDPKYLGPLRTVISESTAILGLDEEVTGKIVLAVTEACANIIRHCYGGKPGERIDVTLRFGPDFYEVRIDDYGEFVDPAKMKGRPLEDVKPGGLGLHFIHSVMDDVAYRKNRWGGTTLTMTKKIEPTDPGGDDLVFEE